MKFKSKLIKFLTLSVIALLSFVMLTATAGCKEPNIITNHHTVISIVKFSEKNVSMLVGDEYFVTANTTTNIAGATVNYSSSNNSVATVDAKSGKVFAVGKGEAVITANYGSYKDTCNVSVSHGNLLPELIFKGALTDSVSVAKGVTYSLNTAVKFNGKDFTNANFSYQYDKQYLSINTSTGDITGLKKGSTEVTVTASWDGFSGIPSLSKTITINVTNYVEIFVNGGKNSSVSLYNKELNTLTGKTVTTSPFVVTAKDEKGLIADSNIAIDVVVGTNVISYSDGVVRGLGALGDAQIRVTVTDYAGDQHVRYYDVNVVRAVGDYATAGQLITVDFDTLSGELDLATIFGDDVQLTDAYLGDKPLTLEDNKIVAGIQGQAFGTPEAILITVYSETEGYNVKILPYVYKNVTDYGVELEFSSYDGVFFDANGDVVSVEDIFGAGAKFTQAYVKTNDGESELLISNDGQNILGVNNGSQMTGFTLAVASETEMKTISVNAATLIIDEFSDFKYFTVKKGEISFNYYNTTRFSFTGGMVWDGYYVMAKDIYYDKSEYTHVMIEEMCFSTGYGHTDYLRTYDFNYTTPNTYETNPTQVGMVGKGLSGVFDGRGHVIYDYSPMYQFYNPYMSYNKTTGVYTPGTDTTSQGLFGVINGGLVKNLAMKNVSTSSYGGFLADMIVYGGRVENCYFEINPNTGVAGYNASGLAGGVSTTCSMENVVFVSESAKTAQNSQGIICYEDVAFKNFANVYIINQYPLKSITATGTTVRDAQWVDGVQLTGAEGTTPFAAGIRRFSNYQNAVKYKDAASVATFSADCWTLLSGAVPVFKSVVELDKLSSYVNDTLVNNSISGMVEIGENNPVTFRTLGLIYAEATKLEVVSDPSNAVTINGNNIIGNKSGTATIKATYVEGDVTVERTFSVVCVPKLETLAEEYYFSAEVGTFYKSENGNLVAVSVDDVFGSQAGLQAVINTADGSFLSIVGDKIMGLPTSKDGAVLTTLNLYGTEKSYAVSVVAYSLIITQASDFDYFSVQRAFHQFGNVTADGGASAADQQAYEKVMKDWVDAGIIDTYAPNVPVDIAWTHIFADGDFEFDGYYYLANDIDMSTAGVHKTSSVAGNINIFTGRGGCDLDGLYSTAGFINTSTNTYKGLSGTFDGNGHVISNLTTEKDGLFGAILGGTVKNVAFINGNTDTGEGAVISWYIARGATFENVFVYNDGSNSYSTYNAPFVASTCIQNIKTNNLVIIDRTTHDSSAIKTYGSLVGNFKERPSTSARNGNFGPNDFNNTYIVSDVALSVVNNSIAVDAQYVDGVATSDQVYIADGLKRYSRISNFAADSSNDYSSFSSTYWELAGGIVPVFKGYTNLIQEEDFYTIKLNGNPLLADEFNTLIGKTYQVVVAKGLNAYTGDVTVTSSNTSIATVNGTTIKMSDTNVGSTTITISFAGITREYVFNTEVPTVFANGEVVLAEGTPLIVGESTTITLEYAGEEVTDFAISTTNTDKISISGKTVTGITSGDAIVTVTIGTASFTFKIGVLSAVTDYVGEQEILFSAADGQLFDIETVFGKQVDILKATDAEGNELKVANNKIIGVASGNEPIDTFITVYSTEGSYKVYVKVYTLIIDEAEDLAYFQAKKKVAGSWKFSFAQGDVEFDGYYLLANNIDATGYTHTFLNGMGSDFASITVGSSFLTYLSDPEQYGTELCNKGLTGTFDGNGYTISNLTTNNDGLFGIVNGGIIKNVAIQNVTTSSTNNATTLAAWLVNGATLENVYLSSAENMTYAASPFIKDMTEDVVFENVVIEYTGSRMSGASTVYLLPYNDAVLTNAKNLVIINNVAPALSTVQTLYTSETGSTTQNLRKVLGDAKYVNGIENSNATTKLYSDTVATSYDGSNYYEDGENGRVLVGNYSIKLYDGVMRFTSLSAMANAYINNTAIFNGFSQELWKIVDNKLVFGKNESTEYDVTLNGAKAVQGVTFERDDVVTVGLIKGGFASSEVPTVEFVSGSVSIDGTNVTLTGAGTAVIKVSLGTWSKNVEITVVAPMTEYNTAESELLFSAADGKFFDANGDVVTFADLGFTGNVIKAEDADSNVLTVEENAVLGLEAGAGAKDYLSTSIVISSSIEVIKVYVKVATLVIDEAEDFKYFQYKGSFTGEGLTAGSKEMISGFAKTAYNEGALAWSGYYVIAKDIDASTASFGTEANPYVLSGSTSIGNIVKATSVRWADANKKGNWDAEYYLYSGYYSYAAGFTGVLDGNGHTVSNFNIYTEASTGLTDGLFGEIRGGVVKNLGWVNSGTLAVLGRGVSVDNCYIYTDNAKPFIRSANTDSVISNTMIVNTYPYALYTGVIGVYNVDEHNVTSTYGTMATFTNVALVSTTAINYGYNSQSTYSFGAIRFDAATVDGVATSGTSNIVYGNAENVDATRTLANAYTYGIQTGAARYTSVAKMVECYNANNSIYAGFTGSVWSVVEGVLTFGA